MRYLTRLAAAALALALTASPAVADVAAVWSVAGMGDLRVYVRDADTFLADPEGPGALLMRQGELWVLTDDDGLRSSRRWEDVARPEAAVAALMDVRDTLKLVSLDQTAIREDRTGLTGAVWRASEGGDGATTITRDVVLTPDSRLALATRALARLGTSIAPYRLAQGAPLEEAFAQAAQRDQGLMRYGDIMALRSVEATAFDEGAFDTEPQSATRPYDTYDFNGSTSPVPERDDYPAVN